MSKRINIFKNFSSSGSHAILVFPYQMVWRYSDGEVSNAGGVGKNAIMSLYLALVPAVKAATGKVLSTESPVDHSHHLASYDIAGSKRWC